MALVAVALVGAVYGGLFWWSMAATGFLWAAGVAVEVFWSYRQEQAQDACREEGTPTEGHLAMSVPEGPATSGGSSRGGWGRPSLVSSPCPAEMSSSAELSCAAETAADKMVEVEAKTDAVAVGRRSR
jgi:hypothetical protein